MPLRIKRKNLQRLASLSALGAGAVTLATGTAEADIVHVVVPPSFPSSFSGPVSLPGGAGFALGSRFRTYQILHFSQIVTTSILGPHRYRTATVRASMLTVDLFVQGTAHGGALHVSGPFSRGGRRRGAAVFSASGTIEAAGFDGFSTDGIRGHAARLSLSTPFQDPFRYLLFQFPDNGKTLFGWAQLEFQAPAVREFTGTIIDYAYDTTGARIQPGQTSPVPEPSETIPLSLGALVLGAAGVRRWRASKAA